MSNIKVLVDGCGGDVAQGVIKALNKSKLNLEIHKICTYYNSSWLHVDDYSYISPLSVSDEYIPYLIRLLNAKRINIFFPCVDFEIPKVALNKEKLESDTPAKIFVDEFDKVEVCNDKYKTDLCIHDQKGFCVNSSEECKYAHGIAELRDPIEQQRRVDSLRKFKT